MPLTIDLPPDTLAALTQFAEDHGVTAEQLAASTLRLTYVSSKPPGAAAIFREELARRVGESIAESVRRSPPPLPPEKSWETLMEEIAEMDREYLAAGGGEDDENDPAEFPAAKAEEKRSARPDAPRKLADAAAACVTP